MTCDRYEKIRVSGYSDSCNIQSYCLGHKEFVTGLSLLPTDETILMSSLGDGTVRFWDYAAGIELYIVDCNDSVPTNDIVEGSKTDNGGCVLPVRLHYMQPRYHHFINMHLCIKIPGMPCAPS
jgi:WD40 repeat protein